MTSSAVGTGAPFRLTTTFIAMSGGWIRQTILNLPTCGNVYVAVTGFVGFCATITPELANLPREIVFGPAGTNSPSPYSNFCSPSKKNGSPAESTMPS